MNQRIDELAQMIRPYVRQDAKKFYTTEEFERNLGQDVGRYFGLKSFVAERGESIRMQLAGQKPASGNGEGNRGDPDAP